MRRLLAQAGAILLALLAAPAAAETGLECVDEGYSPEQLEQIARYVAIIPSGEDAEGLGDEVTNFMYARLLACQNQQGWSDVSRQYAAIYQVNALFSESFIRPLDLDPATRQQIESGFAAKDVARMARILKPHGLGAHIVMEGFAIPEEDTSDDAIYVVQLFYDAGVPEERHPELLAWAVFYIVEEQARRMFLES